MTIKVAKVIVGAMSYGSPEWQEWISNEEDLNTWDTADVYSNGEPERIIAKAIAKYEITRSKLVILSKCHFGVAIDGTQPRISAMSANDGAMVNQVGLSRKHIFDAVEASVQRLGTYIDVLQIHRLDRSVPRKEIMKALNDVVEKGWVRYMGASSMAAWEFQESQWIARTNGWREMIPYCQHTGVGLIPWSPVARGVLTRPWSERSTKHEQSDNFLQSLIRKRENEIDKAIVDRVEEVAKKHGVSIACIATAWSIRKGCCPIIGLGSKERIEEAVANENFQLSEEDAKYLEEPYLPKPVTGY
ncbi:Aldo/keto reductase [Teratosphaeria nubilosa]|uniref:Aldo/keto reductase n=1 Tax=Teratosphaeria nubilosa TaxID=161662 RepID=A0A6G1KY80_9PEZI|nr:Aldo/keto reductase [Teratosphaeria nubilosa]